MVKTEGNGSHRPVPSFVLEDPKMRLPEFPPILLSLSDRVTRSKGGAGKGSADAAGFVNELIDVCFAKRDPELYR